MEVYVVITKEWLADGNLSAMVRGVFTSYKKAKSYLTRRGYRNVEDNENLFEQGKGFTGRIHVMETNKDGQQVPLIVDEDKVSKKRTQKPNKWKAMSGLDKEVQQFMEPVDERGMINQSCGDGYALVCMKKKYGEQAVEEAIRQYRSYH